MAAQSIATRANREKYLMSKFDYLLRNAVVAEKICSVDRSDLKLLQNPYGSTATATVQAIAGTYTVKNFQVTDDTLTVSEEIITSEHIFAHEDIFAQFDLFSSRTDSMMYALTKSIDQYVLNVLCEDGTGAYTTPVGGFTTAANITAILGGLWAKVAGYADTYKGLYLVIEAPDVAGFVTAQMASGFNFSDSALKNGFMTQQAGIDIYVVAADTFTDDTIGTRSDFTNSGHRLFGVKNTATYATPRGIVYDEKKVTGKTGTELVVSALCGAKVWASKAALTIDVTLA